MPKIIDFNKLWKQDSENLIYNLQLMIINSKYEICKQPVGLENISTHSMEIFGQGIVFK